jgi:tRNA-dihydrouridine synthase
MASRPPGDPAPSAASAWPPPALGALALDSPFLLAPLESVSDAAFRRICWELGASLTFTEMVRARAVARRNPSTLALLDLHDPEVPTGIQLLAASDRELREALDALDALADSTHRHLRNACVIDLNFGCPSPDVIRQGAGPALLHRRARMRAIFEVLAAWRARTRLPVRAIGAKVRLGLHAGEVAHGVVLPVVDAASETLDYLTVHARHARQESREPADWAALAPIVARARIPIVGNGDVFGRADAERLRAVSGCAAVLVARGAIRSPWVFRELRGRGPGLPDADELARVEARYFALAARYRTRPKYLEWHREGFRRLRERLAKGSVEGGAGPVVRDRGIAVPRNAHMRG